MTSTRSALFLALVGLLGAVFFWLTDPSLGGAQLFAAESNRIDAANQALPGTVVGLAGSAGVTLTGLWLLMKRGA